MKSLICYYSGSGNTKLACRYLAAHSGIAFDLVDVIADAAPDFALYDVVGLACSTDFWGVPQRFATFLAQIPPQAGKPAFLLTTFGALSGKTFSSLAEQVSARGFTIVGGHSLRMPESYPPMIARGMTAANEPGPKAMLKFDAFIAELSDRLGKVERGESAQARSVPIGLLNSLFASKPRTAARDDMGEKFVDGELCIECGTCAKGCPYHAIELAPKPVFDMSACYGCWRCYNRCAQHAIYTQKLRGPYYPRPSEETLETLKT